MTFRRRSLIPLAAPPIGRRAFTMIELLVVLVIILIVAGLVIVGITSAMSGTRDNATVTRLQMLDGFMAAYQNADNARAGGMGNTEAKRLPEVLKSISTGTAIYSTTDNRAADPGPFTPPPDPGEPLTAPVVGAATPYIGSNPGRFPAQFTDDNWIIEPAVARTQAVLRRLLTVPANQSAFSTVSEDGKTLSAGLTYDPGTGPVPSLLAYAPGSSGTGPLDPPLLVDGFGNVIIFVPVAGLTDLEFADGTVLSATAAPGAPHRLVAANGRAFWASAGADGVFKTADDNVYSTEVIVRNKPVP